MGENFNMKKLFCDRCEDKIDETNIQIEKVYVDTDGTPADALANICIRAYTTFRNHSTGINDV